MHAACPRCSQLEAELAEARAAIEELKAQVSELDMLCTLQKGDLARLRVEHQREQAPTPNAPEHMPVDALQLAFASVVESFGAPTANDVGAAALPPSDTRPPETPPPPPALPPPAGGLPNNKKRKRGHGRREVSMAGLPVVEHTVDPPEVVAANGVGYEKIGVEHSDRLAHRSASWIVLRVAMTKWRKVETTPTEIVRAELPPSVWPRTMADASAITEVILAKYDLSLPLYRQERVSPRAGLTLPRSTLSGWLCEAHSYLYRIVDAMMVDACSRAHCIATDATSAPVRQRGRCGSLHVFVFIADQEHVVFRPVADHTSETIVDLLGPFRGKLLSDASAIYGALYRLGITAVFCWAHVRRYFWKAKETSPKRANEALAILAKLFEIERETIDEPMPDRTEARARRARPILDLFDQWIESVRLELESRTPLEAAVNYYKNQRDGLRRFLDDGWLRIDNNLCEGHLRSLVLGRRNWTFFENINGARWWCVFRSLIASCALHGLEPGEYLEQVLRLAPHWPLTRMLELAPSRWATTLAALSPAERAILRRPWETVPPPVTTVASTTATAA